MVYHPSFYGDINFGVYPAFRKFNLIVLNIPLWLSNVEKWVAFSTGTALLFIVIICYHDIYHSYHYQPILMWYDPKATTINPRISISTSFPVSPAHRFPGMEPQQAADVSSPPRLTPSPEAEDPKTLSIKWPDQVKFTKKRRICWVGPLYTCPCPYESWGHIFRFLKNVHNCP